MTDSAASIRFQTSRAHAPGYSSLGLDRESFPIRTCARLRWRAHSDITPGSQQARNPASHQSDANILPCVGNWRSQPVERCTPYVSASSWLRRLLLRGHAGALNLTGSLSRWSFRTLLQSFQESSRVQPVLLCKNHLSSLAAHVPKHAAWSVGNVRKVVGEIQNVER